MTASLETVQATSAAAFASSLGINTHMDFSWTNYNNFAQVENALSYLGLTNVRDSIDNPSDPGKFQELNQVLGIKYDLFISPGSAGFTWQLQEIESNANIVKFVEGANESDNWPQTYNGLTGLAATEAEQAALYSAIKSYGPTSNIPVIQASFGQLGTFATVGTSIASDANYANAHIYFGTGNNPADGSWISYVAGLAQGITPGKPTIVTETGYYTEPGNTSGVDPTVQAKYMLDDIMDDWAAGISDTYLYELVDEESDPTNVNSEYHFGLFNSNFTPKPAAIALHNLMAIINSTNGAATVANPGTLTYSLSGLPTSAGSELLQKPDGTFVLALWNDTRLSGPTTQTDITVAPVTVTLTLASPVNYVEIFDPLTGTSAIQSYTNATTIQVAVPDHPVLIEFSQNPLPTVSPGPVIAAPARTLTTPGAQVQVDGLQIADSVSNTVTVDISDTKGSLSITSGGVTQTGQSVSVSGTISVVNAALATLNYTGGTSTGTDTISVVTLDGAGLSSSQTIAVTVDTNPTPPTPSTPVLTMPATEQAIAGSASAVSGISLNDPYAAYNLGALYLNVTDSKGLLSMTDWAGNTILGSGTTSITYQATFINIEAALASLTYQAASAGSDTIAITIYDQVGLSTYRTIAVSTTAATSTSTPTSASTTTSASTPSTSTTTSTSTPTTTTSTTSTQTTTTSTSTTSSTTRTATVMPTASAASVAQNRIASSPTLIAPATGGTVYVAQQGETVRVQAGQAPTTIDNFVSGSAGSTLQVVGSSAPVTTADYHNADILWGIGNYSPLVWDMNGSTLTSASFAGSNMPSVWQVGAVGDFAGNGLSDVLWTPTVAGGSAVLWMTGANGVMTPVSLAQYGPVGTKAWTGDFTGNGKDDILWDFGNSAPVLWDMDGSTVISASFIGQAMPAGFEIAGVGDFDGNGMADILWTSTIPGQGPILWLDSATGITAVNLSQYGQVSTKAWIGDFNGDGKSDILWDRGSYAPILWEMNGGTIIGAEYFGVTMPAGWQIAAVGDLENNGLTDVLWTTTAPGGPGILWVTEPNGQINIQGVAGGAGAPGQAFIGNFTVNGTDVKVGGSTVAVLPGVSGSSLTSNNVVETSSTRDYSALTTGVTASLATKASSVAGDNLAGYTSIVGTGYNDTLEGYQGNSTQPSVLTGNGGSDTYQFRSGDGQVVINNGLAGNNAAAGQLDFLGSLTDQNLWLQQSGNNLVVDVLGTKNQVTITNWFATGDAYAQVGEIEAGGLKLDTQVATLVQAMATFSAANAGFNPQTASVTAPSDTTLQTAIAAAWHS